MTLFLKIAFIRHTLVKCGGKWRKERVEGFFGQYNVSMDKKGRVALPSKLRPATSDGRVASKEFILTKGLDGCLAFYPEEQWQIIQQRLGAHNFNQRNYRYFSRMLHSVAVNITLDRQGRLLIPAHLQTDAGLKKEILVIGVNRWIEFWDPEKYNEYLNQYGQSYEEVAEKLFDLNRGEEN